MLENIYEYIWILFTFSLIVVYLLVNLIIDHSISTEKRKTVLITGCDSGFGFVTALELSASNCKVYAGCLTENGVKKLQEHKDFDGKAFIMDVTKEEDIEKAKAIIENEGGIYTIFQTFIYPKSYYALNQKMESKKTLLPWQPFYDVMVEFFF